MLEEIIDNTKIMLSIPLKKSMEKLYFVINKETGKRICGIDKITPLVISKYQIDKLKKEYSAVPCVDAMKIDYEKKLENQRKRMEYDSMSDDEKKNLLRKQLDEGMLNKTEN